MFTEYSARCFLERCNEFIAANWASGIAVRAQSLDCFRVIIRSQVFPPVGHPFEHWKDVD